MIKRSDITESVEQAVSVMPPMGAILKPTEVRDLVAWLVSLKRM